MTAEPTAIGGAPVTDDQVGLWDDTTLDRLRFVADPAADEVIARHAADHAERPGASVSPEQLPRELGRHLVLPPEHRSPPLEEYLAESPPWPTWAERTLVQRGQAFFAQQGLEIGGSLFCASLPEAYAGARGARVLTLTSRMVSTPVRRVNETAQMLFDALQPGGLDVGTGAGYQDIRRVRLMHAAVRWLILNDDRVAKTDDPGAGPRSWSPASGLPINQEDLLGTLMSFTCVVFNSLDRLGIGYRRADAEAYLHTWCLIGHLLGIDPDLLPIEWDSAWALTAAVRRRQQRSSPDGIELGEALAGAMRASIPVPALRGLPDSAVQWLIGDGTAAMVGIGRTNWTRVLFGPLHRIMTVIPKLDENRLARRLTTNVTTAVLRQFVAAGREGSKPPFTLPRDLSRRVTAKPGRWGL